MKWPNTVRNEEVYRRTRAIGWSTTIQRRRLKWFGRVTRADDSTPARRAFNLPYCPIQEIPQQANINLAEYYKIRSPKTKPHLGRGNKHCSRHSNMGSHNKWFLSYSSTCILSFFLTHFFPMHLFSTPWKHQKTLRFSDFFRGWRKGALGTNGLSIGNVIAFYVLYRMNEYHLKKLGKYLHFFSIKMIFHNPLASASQK